MTAFQYISIHALCEEGDFTQDKIATLTAEFLSTPSARRATKDGTMTIMASKFLSTPSARRATHGLQAGDVKVEISIHALCEEGDPCRWVQKPTA